MNHTMEKPHGCALGSAFPELNKAVSQVDEALNENACLLSEVSQELIRTRNIFGPALLPESPAQTSVGLNEVAPVRSPLAQAIVGQTDLLRTILCDLRSINNRSTV